MPTSSDCREGLHRVLDERMSLEDSKTLCFYLGIDPDNLALTSKSALLRELIIFMERRDQITFLCHTIVTLRPDLKEDINALSCIKHGSLPYLDLAIHGFLPPRGIEHDLRNPEKIYLPLKCSSVVQNDPGAQADPGEDAFAFIERIFQDKRVVLIVGNYGAGKSFLTQKLFLHSADAYRTSNDPVHRIPILLPLSQLVGGGNDLAFKKILDLLRTLRFFSGPMHRQPKEEQTELEARLRAGEFLCILDGFDEIPLISARLNPLNELNSIIKCLAVGQNRIIITTRPGILPGVFSPTFTAGLPELGLGFLQPWKSEDVWHKYLLECIRLGVISLEEDYAKFERWVVSKEELKQLTVTPLYCQMLVETRREIMETTDVNLAKLYQTYTERYLENVSLRSPIRLRFKELSAEIEYKKGCLEATAVFMSKKHNLRLTQRELEEALLLEAQDYDDNLLKEFTKLDNLIYSLLVLDAGQMVSFSHKSFYEYFVALKIYHELTGEDDRFDKLESIQLTNEIVTFLSSLLALNPAVTRELASAFTKQRPLEEFGVFNRNKPLLRNLALVQLELTNRLEGVNLEELNFNGYRFSSHQHRRELIGVELNRCEMEGAILNGLVLRNSRMRSAKLNRSILDGADMRGVDLTGASLQDISCRATRFSGADFNGAKFKKQDAGNILEALSNERDTNPGEFDETWYNGVLKILRGSTV